MNVKFDGNRAIFSGEPIGYTFTDVDAAHTEDMEVNGATVKRIIGGQQRGTLTAEQMNDIGWVKGEPIHTLSPAYAREKLAAAQAGSGWTVDSSMSKSHVEQVEGVKQMFFTNIGAKAKIGEDALAMDKEMTRLADQFFEGKITEDELATAFERLANGFISACKEKQYPFAALMGMDEAELSAAYDHFRGALLKSAVAHNNAEGKALTSPINYGWRYYNADYYYQSEKAIAAITGKVQEMAAEKGFDEFGIPDYQALGKNSLYNFNSAVSGESDYIPGGLRAIEPKWIMDFDQVPPEGFQYFYEEGGAQEQASFVEGEVDVTKGMAAQVWAMLGDVRVSAGFNYSLTADLPSDVKNLAGLLQFTPAGKKELAAANAFLKNFQAAPRDYFSVHVSNTGLNVRA